MTEVGRQPWIIHGVMRTEDAVTTVPNQFVALGGFTFVYLILADRPDLAAAPARAHAADADRAEADGRSRHAVE